MKFYATFIVYGILLFIPSLLLRSYLIYDMNVYRERCQINEAVAKDTNIYILGSSHASALVGSVLSRKFGVPVLDNGHNGADVFEMAYEIKSIKRSSPSSKIFIIAMSPFTFHFDNFAYMKHGKHNLRMIRVSLYLKYDNIRDMINRDYSNILFAKLFPLCEPDNLFEFYRDRLRREAENKKQPQKVKRSAPTARFLNEIATRRAECHYNDMIPNMAKNADYNITSETYRMLNQVIKSHGDDFFILFTPPYWSEYYNQIPPDILSTFLELTNKLSRLPNVKYFNDSTNKRFDSPKYFKDGDHISHQGALLYTDYIAEKIARMPQVAKVVRRAAQRTAKDRIEKNNDAVAH